MNAICYAMERYTGKRKKQRRATIAATAVAVAHMKYH